MCLLLITRYWKPNQQTRTSSIPQGRFPSMPELNPMEQCNAMILRGGKQLEGPKGVSNDESLHDKYDDNVEKKVSIPSNDLHSDDVMNDANVVPKDAKQTFLKPYTLPLPFPQRMAKARLDLQCGKFLEILKKLYINILFTDALSQISPYARFLKEILSNKRKLEKHEIVALTEEYSAAI